MSLSEGPHRTGSGDLVGSYDAGAHGGVARNWSNIYDWHACFRTRPPNVDSTLSVPCSSGEGTWIYVEARGWLREEMRWATNYADMSVSEIIEETARDAAEGRASGKTVFYSPGPAVHAATKLVIGAQTAEQRSFKSSPSTTLSAKRSGMRISGK